MSGARAPLHERLWQKVDRSAGLFSCWPFTGARMHNGYGHLGAGGRGERTLAAHRVAYETACGPIPHGLYVLHSCDSRSCCNPAHLRLGTQAENIAEMWAKGRRPRGKAA